MRIIKLQEAKEYPSPPPSKKSSRILLDDESGAKNLALGVATYGKGEKGKFHAHSGEETMYILEGKARIGTQEKDFLVQKDTLIHVPPGESHWMENASDDILRFIWIYTPPGEERAIKERAKK